VIERHRLGRVVDRQRRPVPEPDRLEFGGRDLTSDRQGRSDPTAGADHAPDLSVIVPAFEEEASVGPLYEAIVQAVNPLALGFEIIFVDDGSRDATFARCAALAAGDPRVKVIKFRRNCGQTAAMVAGIEHAAGATLVTMDADLQNDPADIPKLLAKLAQGYDLVVGWRFQRQDKLLSRRLPSVLANRLIAKVTGVDIKDNGCSLKAYRADLIKRVPLYSEMHRFIPAMSSLAGARIAQIKVTHHARRYGRSKYGLSRVYKVLADLLAIKTLLLFAARPLFCFIGSAAVAGALSLSCALAAIYHALLMEASSVVVLMGVSILFGTLSLFLALLGLIGYLIYQMASDDWDMQPLQAWSRQAADAPSDLDRP
jgi:glycosyltransferase involved in cell wall biosynthesis